MERRSFLAQAILGACGVTAEFVGKRLCHKQPGEPTPAPPKPLEPNLDHDPWETLRQAVQIQGIVPRSPGVLRLKDETVRHLGCHWRCVSATRGFTHDPTRPDAHQELNLTVGLHKLAIRRELAEKLLHLIETRCPEDHNRIRQLTFDTRSPYGITCCERVESKDGLYQYLLRGYMHYSCDPPGLYQEPQQVESYLPRDLIAQRDVLVNHLLTQPAESQQAALASLWSRQPVMHALVSARLREIDGIVRCTQQVPKSTTLALHSTGLDYREELRRVAQEQVRYW